MLKALIVVDIQEEFKIAISVQYLLNVLGHIENGVYDKVLVVCDTNDDEVHLPYFLCDYEIAYKKYGGEMLGHYLKNDNVNLITSSEQDDFIELIKDKVICNTAKTRFVVQVDPFTYDTFEYDSVFDNKIKSLLKYDVDIIGGARLECLNDVLEVCNYNNLNTSVIEHLCFDINSRMYNEKDLAELDSNMQEKIRFTKMR